MKALGSVGAKGIYITPDIRPEPKEPEHLLTIKELLLILWERIKEFF